MKLTNIKLVMSDIDDTLLDSEKNNPVLNVEAIKAIKKQGVKFGIATGRSAVLVPLFFKDWHIDGLVDYVVGSNGAELLVVESNELYNFHHLSVQTVKDIAKEYDGFNMSVCVYNNDELWANKSTREYEDRLSYHKLKRKIINFETDIAKSYPKVLGICEKEDQLAILDYANNHKSQYYKVFPSNPKLLEFTNPLLSKTFGIEKICEIEDINKFDVLTFGDTTNDIEMLRDFIGVCMMNGTDDAKAVSKYVTSSNNDAGLGYFLFENVIKKA